MSLRMSKYERFRTGSINSPENLFITVRRRNYFRLSYLILQSSNFFIFIFENRKIPFLRPDFRPHEYCKYDSFTHPLSPRIYYVNQLIRSVNRFCRVDLFYSSLSIISVFRPSYPGGCAVTREPSRVFPRLSLIFYLLSTAKPSICIKVLFQSFTLRIPVAAP